MNHGGDRDYNSIINLTKFEMRYLIARAIIAQTSFPKIFLGIHFSFKLKY